jgi:hypothetical protein
MDQALIRAAADGMDGDAAMADPAHLAHQPVPTWQAIQALMMQQAAGVAAAAAAAATAGMAGGSQPTQMDLLRVGEG